jgi:hypothetical protein
MTVKVRTVGREEDEEIYRYMVPPAEDLPLLKVHYPGEWFERIDGRSIVRRWITDDGESHHELLFYPPHTAHYKYEALEHEPDSMRNDYFLLLWKMLNKFGIAKYTGVPHEVSKKDFDRFLNKPVRIPLFVKPERLKLKVNQ